MRSVYFHNPRCTKSREGLAMLEERGVRPEVVPYLERPLTEAELRDVLSKLEGPKIALVRLDDARAAGVAIDKAADVDAIVAVLVEHPALMQRPLFVRGERAVLGRPVENLLALLATPADAG